LPSSEEEELARHLAECDGCRVESARMKRLVSVLHSFPEEDWSRPLPAMKRTPPIWMAVAAAVLFALGVFLAVPRWGSRPTLEGDFVQGPDGTWTASGASSAVDLADHRCACRKGTRIRISGRRELQLDSGRLDVTGQGGKFAIGTPLGRIDVLGTDFTVEVMPMKKAGTIGGGFLVGVFVSSGVVSYADLRVEPGQAVVAETGKPARKVQGRELEHRLRTAQEAGRDLERKLAALDFERSRLAGELAAAQGGKPAPAPAKLTPEDRRERFRRLARHYVRDQGVGTIPPEGDDPEAVAAKNRLDQNILAEAVAAANDLGVPVFSASSILIHREFAQELLLEALEMSGGSKETHRALIDAAVEQAYATLKESSEFGFEKSLAALQAFGRAIDRLENGLPAKEMEGVVRVASAMMGAGPLPSFSTGAAQSFTPDGVAGVYSSILVKNMGLEENQAPIVQAAVNEWMPSVMADTYPDNVGKREHLRYMLRARERTVTLARRLIAKFPDKKERIEAIFSW
jgi:hypothetical protein